MWERGEKSQWERDAYTENAMRISKGDAAVSNWAAIGDTTVVEAYTENYGIGSLGRLDKPTARTQPQSHDLEATFYYVKADMD
eukprot:scaffold613943_cov19-Prasinocladus_malaysianus.AAC.1